MSKSTKQPSLVLPALKQRVFLRPDGRLHRIFNAFGARVIGPVTQAELKLGFTEPSEDIKPICIEAPPIEWKLPHPTLLEWATRLIQYPTESLCIYGRHRTDPALWLAVIPKQEVTSASVDVDDMSKARAYMSKAGYTVVGTIHTHPGGMTGYSGTDSSQLWDEWGGVHFIVARTGGVGVYFAMRKQTWKLIGDTWTIPDLWTKTPKITPPPSVSNMFAEDGTKDYDKFITAAKSFWQAPNHKHKKHEKSLYDNYDDWYNTKNTTGGHYDGMYFGVWDSHKRKYIYEKQPSGTVVYRDYADYWPTMPGYRWGRSVLIAVDGEAKQSQDKPNLRISQPAASTTTTTTTLSDIVNELEGAAVSSKAYLLRISLQIQLEALNTELQAAIALATDDEFKNDPETQEYCKQVLGLVNKMTDIL